MTDATMESEMVGATQFGFTKLVVADIARSVAFYRSVFGLEPLHEVRAEDHAYALEETIMAPPGAAGGHKLIITRYLVRAVPPAGAAWTGFVVADLDMTIALAERCGGHVEVPAHHSPGHPVCAAIVGDPDGHLVEIIQLLGAGA